ncbi:MAG: hypothetical protein IIB74_09145 [Proteobacteria bacterium]|nr:hypothetical protein [Pseudomonadota bacterium]
MQQIKDLELTLRIIPKMTKYDAFGKPDKNGEYCCVDGEWLRQTLTELKQLRETVPVQDK